MSSSADSFEQVHPSTPALPHPVFLLAPARSYSTVALALLAGHPDIFGFPEMLLFTHETVGEVLDSTIFAPDSPRQLIRMKLGGVCRAISQINEGSQSADALDRAYQWLRQRSDWTSVHLYRHLLDSVHPQVGLEKSPETSADASSLTRCVEGFPDARYIHLVRHPVTTQRSMRENWVRHFTGFTTSQISIHCANAWYLSHHRIRRVLSRLPEGQAMTIRAEDLLDSPQKHLGTIFDWLGLSSDEDVVRKALNTEDWIFAGTGEAGGLYGGDTKFMLAPRLRAIPDPGPLEFPEEWEIPAAVSCRMTEMAHSFGYF